MRFRSPGAIGALLKGMPTITAMGLKTTSPTHVDNSVDNPCAELIHRCVLVSKCHLPVYEHPLSTATYGARPQKLWFYPRANNNIFQG